MPERPNSAHAADPRALTRVTPDRRLWACTHDGCIVIGSAADVPIEAGFGGDGSANHRAATDGLGHQAAESDLLNAILEDR